MTLRWSKGRKYAVSISINEELLEAVRDYEVLEGCPNLSEAVRRLLRLGLVYLKVMEEQRKMREKQKQEQLKKAKEVLK